jgi:hypothetical protein
MRAGLAMFVELPADVRAPRLPKPPSGAQRAGLSEIMRSAQQAIPDGRIREIRLPEDYGNVQVRMWREGDDRRKAVDSLAAGSASSGKRTAGSA